jgi:hypothetical protein
MTYELIIRAILSGILMGAIYGVLGMGFTIVYGILDLPIFTHGVFAMWAMYLLYMLTNYTGVGPYPGFLVLFAVAYVFGVVLYKSLLRFILDIEHEMQLVFFQLGAHGFWPHIFIAERQLAGTYRVFGTSILEGGNDRWRCRVHPVYHMYGALFSKDGNGKSHSCVC